MHNVPFRPLDLLNGLDAMVGDPRAYAAILRLTPECWDSIRAYIRRRELVQTIGQLTRLTRAGRKARRQLRKDLNQR